MILSCHSLGVKVEQGADRLQPKEVQFSDKSERESLLAMVEHSVLLHTVKEN